MQALFLSGSGQTYLLACAGSGLTTYYRCRVDCGVGSSSVVIGLEYLSGQVESVAEDRYSSRREESLIRFHIK